MSSIVPTRSVSQLYPPPQPPGLPALVNLVSSDKHHDGRSILYRELTDAERKVLADRKCDLIKWTSCKGFGSPSGVIARMYAGLSQKSLTKEEAQLITAQYTFAVRDVPAWAVERACIRFETGAVTAEELGAKKFDLGFPPSTAQLHAVARAFVTPLLREYKAVHLLLTGTVATPTQTPEQQRATADKIADHHEDFRRKMEEGRLDETEAELERVAARSASIAATTDRQVVQQYVDAGLVPPERNAAGFRTSLPMMLKCGWRIEEVGGKNVLVAPPAKDTRTPKRKTETAEMGS